MSSWIPCELHTHTINSDGSFTFQSLCQHAKDKELQCFALTDHNTIAGWQDIDEAKKNNTELLPIIKGIEWTTYFGHMVILNPSEYVDWRQATIPTIDNYIKLAKEKNGLVGIAHPFRPGGVLCTGGTWEFEINNWENVDYMEVWSREFPTSREMNMRATKLWIELLDQGHQIAASFGKDWHGPESGELPDAATYVEIQDQTANIPNQVLAGIKAGRTFVSMAPTLEFTLEQEGQTFLLGDVIKKGTAKATLNIALDSRKSLWGRHNVSLESAHILTNAGKCIKTIPLSNDQILNQSFTELLEIDGNYVRVEIHGTIANTKTVLAISSPIYVN